MPSAAAAVPRVFLRVEAQMKRYARRICDGITRDNMRDT